MAWIKKAENEADYHLCADIWLESSQRAHSFISPAFWADQRQSVAEHYLPGSTVYMALDDNGRVDGFAALVGSRLGALFVRPGNQGRGVGRALMRHLFGRYDQLSLSVYLKNKPAIAFYEQMGFEVTGEGICRNTGEAELSMVWQKKASPEGEGDQ